MNEWEYMKEGDDDNLYCGDGSCRPLCSADYTLPWGKYKGLTLAEVTDRSYLQWLKNEVAKEKNDWFVDRIVSIRLKELQ